MKYFWVTLLLSGSLFAQTFTTLHKFSDQQPSGQLVMDAAGNLYGTTWNGGKFNMGTIFELVPQTNGTWKHVGLYSFAGGQKGFTPWYGLTADGAGNFVGTTAGEGTVDGQGSVAFRMSQVNGKWTVKIISRLGFPASGPLSFDAKGNMYGTAGGGNSDNGVVYMLAPGASKPAIVYAFGDVLNDGSQPVGGVAVGPDGTLYGATERGGLSGYGTVYSITPQGAESSLYNFSGSDGQEPMSGVTLAPNGSILGTTRLGGINGNGVVWKITQGVFTDLYEFHGSTDGECPNAGVILDQTGNIYGTTSAGGNNKKGLMFELSPSETVLHIFSGAYSSGNLMLDGKGNLYGADALNPTGTVFKLAVN